MAKKEFLFLIAIGALFIFPATVRGADAVLYFSPASASYYQGNSFWVNIMVNTGGQAVNAVAAYFSYPEDKLEPLGVSTAGSVMTIWAEKNAAGGKIEIAGGLPTPGFSGIQKIASIGFKVKVSSGSANFQFSSASAVLTNADNKNILNLTTSGQGNYNFRVQVVPPAQEVTPPVISEVLVSSTTQKQATISWKTDKDANSLVEYGLTADYGFSVSDEKLTQEHSLTIPELSPGTVYYFRAKSQISGKETATENLTFATLGYQVEIQVLNSADKKPLREAVVLFPGTPDITKTTDQEGRVFFESLPLGTQWISVKYKGTSLSYPIEILDKEGIQSFKVGFEIVAATGKISLALIILLIISLIIASIWTIIETRFSKRITKPMAEREKPEDNLPTGPFMPR